MTYEVSEDADKLWPGPHVKYHDDYVSGVTYERAQSEILGSSMTWQLCRDDRGPPWLTCPDRLEEWERIGLIMVDWTNVIRRVMMLPPLLAFPREFPASMKRLNASDGPMRKQDANESVSQHFHRSYSAYCCKI